MAFGSQQWMYASGEDFTIDQSLRFEQSRSTYLEKDFGTATNRKIWTFTGWFKRGLQQSNDSSPIITTELGESNNSLITFGGHQAGADDISVLDYLNGSTANFHLVTNAEYRDPSAWFHLLVAYDSTQGTAANRVKIYFNGEQITSFSREDYPVQNYETYLNSAVDTQLGWNYSRTGYWDGNMAEVHFIDGTALTPTSFGETGDYGEWKPKQVSGLTYGTNGFYLSFAGGGIMSVTGGDSTDTDGDYKAVSFTQDGTFTPSADGEVEYLVIAGGGAGGSGYAVGGGGAGGYKTGYLAVTSQAYSITVGDGGAVGSSGASGGDGDNSVFSTITSTGGGGGGGSTGGDIDGNNGGSGGGCGRNGSTAGTGTSGQGNNGGTGCEQSSDDSDAGGGGGGATAAGSNGTCSTSGAGGNGGNGTASSITGSSVTRAGGGGGGARHGSMTQSSGGSGGGGAGSLAGGSSTIGTANTGGGGGGGGNNTAGGAGGSGVVIIRYKFQ